MARVKVYGQNELTCLRCGETAQRPLCRRCDVAPGMNPSMQLEGENSDNFVRTVEYLRPDEYVIVT